MRYVKLLLISFGIAVVGLSLFLWYLVGGPPSGSASPPSDVAIDASVNFTGTQFVIRNDSKEDWLDTVLEVNRTAVFSNDGYTCQLGSLDAGQTATVGALQCAKGDGTRLNPYSVKPQTATLRVDLPGGRNGRFSGGWK